MKKLFALSTAALAALALVGCKGDETPEQAKTVKLVYSGPTDMKDFNLTLFEDFKAAQKAAGDNTVYEITYEEHGADKVDSEVQDWTTGPNVFEYASDKVAPLYQKGALAKVAGANLKFIDETMTETGKQLATFNGTYYGYPWSGDNTYYLQYDKSVVTVDQAKNVKTLLDALHAKDKKLVYNLPEGFWGAGAMFTFGADYKITYGEDGQIVSTEADFDGVKGQKAAKGILEIINHPAWTKDEKDPKAAAFIAGTWAIKDMKTKFGENYAADVMPQITVDGETKNLGCFVGGKLLGVNPQRGTTEEQVAAHKLAKFLASDVCQAKRFAEKQVGPCATATFNSEAVKADYNMQVLLRQQAFGHAQTAVPAGVWTAPNTLITGMIDKTVTGANLIEAVKTFNDTVKSAK